MDVELHWRLDSFVVEDFAMGGGVGADEKAI